MGKNTLKNTDFLGKREKITSKSVKITVFYYLCTVMQSKAKQCKVMLSNSSINNEYIPTEYESKELYKNQVTQVEILLA